MKALITGGCGFLGSNLASEILKQGGHQLTLLDNLTRLGSEKNLEWLKAQGNFEFIQADIRARETVESTIKKLKPDVIFHTSVSKIKAACEQIEPMEGCLSIPGLQGQVKRFNEIRVRGQDQRGKPISKKYTELESRVVQHEVDHLDGILFIDRADPETVGWVLGDDDDEEGHEEDDDLYNPGERSAALRE